MTESHDSAGSERRPVSIIRSRHLNATPKQLFAALEEPEKLVGILPRVQQIEVLERGQNWSRVVAHLSFSSLGTIRATGEVQWLEGREVVFTSNDQVSMRARWLLEPVPTGTEATVMLELDLSPMLGSLAALITPRQIEAIVAPDLDKALDAMEQRAASMPA